MISIEAIEKRFTTALQSQRGHRSRYLQIQQDRKATKLIANVLHNQKQVCDKAHIDIRVKRLHLRHGTVKKVTLKNIEKAWQDIEKKLTKFQNKQPGQLVEWTVGELTMLNGVTEVINQELSQIQTGLVEQFARQNLIICKIHQDGGRNWYEVPQTPQLKITDRKTCRELDQKLKNCTDLIHIY